MKFDTSLWNSNWICKSPTLCKASHQKLDWCLQGVGETFKTNLNTYLLLKSKNRNFAVSVGHIVQNLEVVVYKLAN